ncbi:MAG: phosphatase PAP2 family protein [Spirochaetaceae bacterium]|nr:phosphatase PAP2 family protein [Spirochaetaceae bacterium]
MRKRLLAAWLFALSVHGFAQNHESIQDHESAPSTFQQSAFTWSVEKDAPLGFLSLAVMLSPLFVHNEPKYLPGKQDRNNVPFFDRPLMAPYNEPLDIVSDYGVYGILFLPVLSVWPNIGNTNTLLTYAVMYTEAFLLTAGTKNLLKNTVIRYRPYVYADGIPSGKERDYDNSFPSGSTAYAFLGAGFLSATFSREFPESLWKIPFIAGSYALAAGIASMRIASGSHFLSDVLTGAAIGSLYGWLIPALHRRPSRATIHVSSNALIVSLKL